MINPSEQRQTAWKMISTVVYELSHMNFVILTC